MTRQSMGALALVAACGGTPAASPPPKTAEQPATPRKTMDDEDVEEISGTIESIRLQNINKALDHYTYNVELVVARPGADPITVRVDKLYWSTMTQKQRDAVAPDGPKHELHPATWRDWTVGEPVELRARVTSPGLAHLVR